MGGRGLTQSRWGGYRLGAISIIFFTLLAGSIASAQEFTAATLSNFGDITVMASTGNYDAVMPDGSDNAAARQAIAREFYKTHADAYDFLVIFAGFDFKMPATDTAAFFQAVRNDVQGIGQELFDNSVLYGSNSRLQGTIDMGNLARVASDPLDPDFTNTMTHLSHEFLHRWAAYVKFVKDGEPLSSDLLGKGGAHWSFLLDTAGSLMYGNRWHDNGDGTFTALAGRKYYSPMDLYLMGFIDASEVPPMRLIQNEDTDPARLPEAGATIDGTARYITVEDIIAAEGERTPSAADSQKEFKFAFILLTRPGTYSSDVIPNMRTIISQWQMWISSLTDGKGFVRADRAVIVDLPENPGLSQPPHTPRSTPAEINEGVAWLMNNQEENGSWQDSIQTTERDTSEAVAALSSIADAQLHVARAAGWMTSDISGNLDYLCRKIEALSLAGQTVSDLMQDLIARQNPDGGWGSNRHYTSDPLDTALALKTLAVVDYKDPDTTAPAIDYLKAAQNPDGGWGSHDSRSAVQATVVSLGAFAIFREGYSLDPYIQNALTWLVNRQNPDGGFGNSPSTVYDTAAVLAVSKSLDIPADVTNAALRYLLNLQSENGSWYDSTYQTAAALRGLWLWQDTVRPDLVASAADIFFEPASVTALPQDATVTAAIRNTGLTDVLETKVVLYDGSISPSTRVGELSLAVAAGSSATASFDVVINDGNPHSFYVTVDPENFVNEANETNNAAARVLENEMCMQPELSVSSADISFSPAAISRLPENITVTAGIENNGLMDITGGNVALYEGAISEASRIGEQIVAVAAKSSTTVNFPVAVTDGTLHRYFVRVDPDNLIAECDENNNTALKALYSDTTYDFSIQGSDITASPQPAPFDQEMSITIHAANEGTTDAFNVPIRVYIDDPGGPYEISTFTKDIAAGAAVTHVVTWRAAKYGENISLTVQVDPGDAFTELSEENNTAAIPVTINPGTKPNLTVFHQEIEISPSPAHKAGNANITAAILNNGFVAAENIEVRVYHGIPSFDGVLLGSRIIPSLEVDDRATVSIEWTDIDAAGDQIITVEIDPDDQIAEMNEDDNSAFKNLEILDLPDLAISSYSISFDPAAPRAGDAVTIHVNVRNAGEQDASDVAIKAYEGSTTIAAGNIPLISGGSMNQISFAYDSAGKTGFHEIRIAVDPDNTIQEQDESNNTAARTLGVQDEDIWLTQLYISPNGDGIQDITHFFFRLDTPQSVNIAITGEYNETVRRYAGSEFENTTGGSITWDGLDDEGRVVADASYRIQVLNENGTVLTGLSVIVDNNRSPLTEAFGTEYLLQYDIQADIPEFDDNQWAWSPDESRIFFWSQDWFPELGCAGCVYRMAPDGSDIQALPFGGGGGWWVSPDGEKIAFFLGRYYDPKTLWIADSDGSNMMKLHTPGPDDKGGDAYLLDWYPDSSYLAFRYLWDELWVVRPDGTGKTRLDFDDGNINHAFWSPDGSMIARDGRITGNNKVKAFDLSGNGIDVDIFEGASLDLIGWLDNQKIVVQDELDYPRNQTIWLIDASGEGKHISIATGMCYVGRNSINPNGSNFVLEEYDSEHRSYNLKLYDGQGNYRVLQDKADIIHDHKWSHDGNKLAYLYREVISDGFAIYLAVIDFTTTEKEVFKLYEIPDTLAYGTPSIDWFSDNTTLLVKANSLDDAFAINYRNGEKKYLGIDGWEETRISPLGNYVTYSTLRARWSTWAIRSLLNLSAKLWIGPTQSALILKGIAADLNFSGYFLEYADIETPDSWTAINPPADVPVANGILTSWIPPYEGTFYVRLTVFDKAGNTVSDIQRVSWGKLSSITNIYKTEETFSPNGDGVKDSATLHYSVLDAVHLEFFVYDEKDNLVRKLVKDHAVPGEGSISWDGKDQSGQFVEDGIYRIKIFDYDFFYVVDNSPPEVHLEFSPISADLSATLLGRVDDINLKNWIIEYGEGQNPEQWYEYKSGTLRHSGVDDEGNPILHELVFFKPSELEFCAGKRFRLTAEDSGGNRATRLTDFLEEILVLHEWKISEDSESSDPWHQISLERQENGEFLSTDVIPPAYTWPGTHYMKGLQTITTPITSASVQVRTNMQWIDNAAFENPSTGLFILPWDNSELPPEGWDAVRLKLVDTEAEVHYSNAVPVKPSFEISCDTAKQGALEDLVLLKFQVISEMDNAYSQWTDYKIYDDTLGDAIPIGDLSLPLLPELTQRLGYRLKMVGTGASGNGYESNTLDFSDICLPTNVKLYLKITDQPAEGCDELSPGKLVASARVGIEGNDSDAIELKTLSYFIEEAEGSRLLRQYDLATEAPGTAVIMTDDMPEGSHSVKAVLEYLNHQTTLSKEASGNFVVDRTLPEAEITFPASVVNICPMRIDHSAGEWFGVHIEGRALDDRQVQGFKLYYGPGQDPSEWRPAYTRTAEPYNFVKPIEGQRPIQGRIGIWDVTNLEGNLFSLKLEVIDTAGNRSCYTTSFLMDTVVHLSSSSDKRLLSPNGDGILDDLEVTYSADEQAAIGMKVVKGQTVIKNMELGQADLDGTGTHTWDGRDDSGNLVPDGDYEIVVTATDACMNTTQNRIGIEIDNTPPETIIINPRPGDPVGNIIEIKGTVQDPNLTEYSLEVGEGDVPAFFTLIANGTLRRENEILGTWNTFGREGLWTLRLTAKDKVGNPGETIVVIELPIRQDLIKDLGVNPQIFSPDNDGKSDSTEIRYELNTACNVALKLLNPQGTEIDTLTTASVPAGIQTFT